MTLFQTKLVPRISFRRVDKIGIVSDFHEKRLKTMKGLKDKEMSSRMTSSKSKKMMTNFGRPLKGKQNKFEFNELIEIVDDVDDNISIQTVDTDTSVYEDISDPEKFYDVSVKPKGEKNLPERITLNGDSDDYCDALNIIISVVLTKGTTHNIKGVSFKVMKIGCN